jgi:hypothetical protein
MSENLDVINARLESLKIIDPLNGYIDLGAHSHDAVIHTGLAIESNSTRVAFKTAAGYYRDFVFVDTGASKDYLFEASTGVITTDGSDVLTNKVVDNTNTGILPIGIYGGGAYVQTNSNATVTANQILVTDSVRSIATWRNVPNKASYQTYSMRTSSSATLPTTLASFYIPGANVAQLKSLFIVVRVDGTGGGNYEVYDVDVGYVRATAYNGDPVANVLTFAGADVQNATTFVQLSIRSHSFDSSTMYLLGIGFLYF